ALQAGPTSDVLDNRVVWGTVWYCPAGGTYIATASTTEAATTTTTTTAAGHGLGCANSTTLTANAGFSSVAITSANARLEASPRTADRPIPTIPVRIAAAHDTLCTKNPGLAHKWQAATPRTPARPAYVCCLSNTDRFCEE